MTFSTPTSAATVWTNPARTLTGNGTAITTTDAADNLVISNGTTVSFVTSVGIMRIISIVGIATANATYNFGLTNGVTFRQSQAGVSGAAAFFHAACNHAEGPGLNNSGTVSGAYTYAAATWNA